MTGAALGAQGQSWWRKRSVRERALLGAMAAALALYVLVVWVAQPMRLAREQALASISRSDAALAQLEAQPLDAAPTIAADDRTVAAVITDTAATYDLAIRRIEALDQGARIEIDDAGFAEIVLWIDELEREHALRAVSVEMDRRLTPGVVSARLTVTR